MGLSNNTFSLQVKFISTQIAVLVSSVCFSLKTFKKDVVFGKNSCHDVGTTVKRSIIGDNVKIGKHVKILNSFIFPGCVIGDHCTISHAVIGTKCVLKNKCLVTAGSVLGQGVEIESDLLIEDTLVQATKPDFCKHCP